MGAIQLSRISRYQAFAIHLSISVCIFTSVVLLVGFAWYPDIYFTASGVWSAMKYVAIVDVVLGPLMTLILFKPGKPGLVFDLVVIACFQVVALCYGVWVLYSEKPAALVFSEGIFTCFNQKQYSFAGADPSLLADNAEVPVLVLPPLSPDQAAAAQKKIKQLPVDYPKIPASVLGELFVPLDKTQLNSVLVDRWDLEPEVKHNARSRQAWEAYQQQYGVDAKHAFFPISCGYKQYMMAITTGTGDVVTLLDIPFVNARQYKIWNKSG